MVHHFPFGKFLVFDALPELIGADEIIIYPMLFVVAGLAGGAGNGKGKIVREGVKQMPGYRCFAGAGWCGDDDEFVKVDSHVQRKEKIKLIAFSPTGLSSKMN